MFWKPGQTAPGSGVDRESENEAVVPVDNPNKRFTIAQQRRMLPIYRYRESILYAVERYRTVVILGETGSGKTTQLPQFLFEVLCSVRVYSMFSLQFYFCFLSILADMCPK